jgi:hypothetical protein
MSSGALVALVGLLLVAAVLLFGVSAVLIGLWWWSRPAAPARPAVASRAATPAPAVKRGTPSPVPIRREAAPAHEDALTEQFHVDSLVSVYDADEYETAELHRSDGGILIDGRTDPAIGRTGIGRVVAKKT